MRNHNYYFGSALRIQGMDQKLFLTRVTLSILVISFLSAGIAAAEHEDASVSVDGVTIEMDAEMRADWSEFGRKIEDRTDISVPSEVQFLQTESAQAYAVFSDSEPAVSESTVKGYLLREATPEQVGIIIANDVDRTLDSQRVSREELEHNPRRYHGKMVETTGFHSEASFRGEYQDVYESLSAGALSGSASGPVFARRVNDLIEKRPLGRQSRWSLMNMSSADNPEALLRVFAGGVGVWTASHRNTFWSRGEVKLLGAVVTHGPLAASRPGRPELHVLAQSFKAKELARVSDISSVDSGSVIRVESQVVGGRVDAKKAALQAAQCGSVEAEAVTFPPTGCLPLTTSTIIHSGVLYGPAKDPIYYAGLSNQQQSQLAMLERGEFEVTGRVVDTARIDPRLPEGKALIVYKMDRRGGLDTPATDQLRSRRSEVSRYLERQLMMDSDEWQRTAGEALASRRTTESKTPSPSATPTPSPTETATDSTTPSPLGSDGAVSEIETVEISNRDRGFSTLDILPILAGVMGILCSMIGAGGAAHTLYTFKQRGEPGRWTLDDCGYYILFGFFLGLFSLITGWGGYLAISMALSVPTLAIIGIVYFGAFLEE
jgi:hypothetical protein